MNWLSSLITSLSACSICYGALLLICPCGNMKTSVKYIVSLCYLMAIISITGITIKRSDISFSLPTVSYQSSEELQISALEYTFSLALENAGIEFKEINVFTDNLSEGSISITKVQIYSNCPRQKILAALDAQNSDFEVEVINE